MAVDFFFYGTLRDTGVRRIVFGPGAFAEAAEPASLEGYRCALVERGRFPAIVEQRDATVQGVLVRGVSLDAAARVSYFEDDGSYYDVALKSLRVAGSRSADAWVYTAGAVLPVEAGIWRFEAWQQHWRPEFLATARAAMTAATPAELRRYRRAWRGRLSPAPGTRSPSS